MRQRFEENLEKEVKAECPHCKKKEVFALGEDLSIIVCNSMPFPLYSCKNCGFEISVNYLNQLRK